MEHNLKMLLAKVSPRETRELLTDHVKKVELDPTKKNLTLFVDKRYAFNAIISHEHIARVIKAVKKAFGDSFGTIIQVAGAHFPSEREKNLPHSIHYR